MPLACMRAFIPCPVPCLFPCPHAAHAMRPMQAGLATGPTLKPYADDADVAMAPVAPELDAFVTSAPVAPANLVEPAPPPAVGPRRPLAQGCWLAARPPVFGFPGFVSCCGFGAAPVSGFVFGFSRRAPRIAQLGIGPSINKPRHSWEAGPV